MREIRKFRLYRMPMKREMFLNRMAKRGWELTDVSPNGLHYTFRKCENTEYRYKMLIFPEDKKQENTLIRGEVHQAGGEYIFEYGITQFVRMKKEETGRFQKYTSEEWRREILFSLIVTGACAAVLLTGSGSVRHLIRLGPWAIPEILVSAILVVLAVRFLVDAVRLVLSRNENN